MKEGWVPVHRSLLNWEWYKDSNTCKLYFHLLLTANFEVQKWQGKVIQPGQVIVGRRKLAEELNLSEQEIRTSINKLKSTNDIAMESTNKFSIVTVCNYGINGIDVSRMQPTNQPAEQQTNNQPSTTIKERKEFKNKERMKFIPPSLSGIESYFSEKLKEKGSTLNPKTEAVLFESFYSSKNWMVGKNKMTDWKKSVVGWIARDKTIEPSKQEIKLNLNQSWL